MFRPGELDQRVTVQRQTLTQDGLGGDALAWVDQGAYWCHVRPLSGRESTGFDQLQGEARKQPKTRALYIEVTAERGVAQ